MAELKMSFLANGTARPAMTDLQVVSMWSALGLLLCELQIRFGFVPDFAQLLAIAG